MTAKGSFDFEWNFSKFLVGKWRKVNFNEVATTLNFIPSGVLNVKCSMSVVRSHLLILMKFLIASLKLFWKSKIVNFLSNYALDATLSRMKFAILTVPLVIKCRVRSSSSFFGKNFKNVAKNFVWTVMQIIFFKCSTFHDVPQKIRDV